jgi:glycosidase
MIIKSKSSWVEDAIFYQIFPDRFYNGNFKNDPPSVAKWGSSPTRDNLFGGDLEGIKKKLPYLKEIGINAIYLNPIFKAGTNHKYDTWDYYEVDPMFGSKGDLLNLIKEVHKLKMKIILDGVFNHCGDGFWAFRDVKEKGICSGYHNWFVINGDNISEKPLNYQTAGGAKYLPKFNYNNKLVREYILRVAEYWTKEAEIDGWRIDIPWKVPMDFWQIFRKKVKEINPDAYIVGEIWRDATPWIKGNTFDGVMNYRLRDLVIDFFIKDSIDAEDFDYELLYLRELHNLNAYVMLNLLSSHDVPRILTVANNNIKRLIVSVVFLMTYIGVPMIYYGDEVGMVGENDPDCRRTMIWDKSLWNKEINDIYRKLIRFRMEHESLRSGSFKTLLVFNRLYAYQRLKGPDTVIIVLNPGEKQDKVTVPFKKGAIFYKTWVDIFTENRYKVAGDYLVIKNVPELSALVLKPYKTQSKNCVA